MPFKRKIQNKTIFLTLLKKWFFKHFFNTYGSPRGPCRRGDDLKIQESPLRSPWRESKVNKFTHLKLICQVLHVDVCMFVKLPKNQMGLNLRQYEFQAEKISIWSDIQMNWLSLGCHASIHEVVKPQNARIETSYCKDSAWICKCNKCWRNGNCCISSKEIIISETPQRSL